MPATMMHLLAARRLWPSADDDFLWGSILPDCVDGDRALKDRLHFRDIDPKDRPAALLRFGKRLDLKKRFDLGVLFHFYLDYLWDRGPQQEHRNRFCGEEWFPAYRKELAAAGSRCAQRSPWNQEVWERLRHPNPAILQNSLGLPQKEIYEFLEFNARWHTEERLPESPEFTDALVDEFLENAMASFRRYLKENFGEYGEQFQCFGTR